MPKIVNVCFTLFVYIRHLCVNAPPFYRAKEFFPWKWRWWSPISGAIQLAAECRDDFPARNEDTLWATHQSDSWWNQRENGCSQFLWRLQAIWQGRFTWLPWLAGLPRELSLTLGTIDKGRSYEAVFRAKHTARHAASLVPFTFKKDVIKTRALLENLKTIKIYWLPLHTTQGHVVHYLEKWGTVKDQWFTVSGDGVPSSVRGFQIALDPNNPDNGSAPMARSVGKVFESQPGDRGSIPTKLANFISYFQINTQHRTLSAHSCPIGPGLYFLLDPSPFFVFHGSLKAYIW